MADMPMSATSAHGKPSVTLALNTPGRAATALASSSTSLIGASAVFWRTMSITAGIGANPTTGCTSPRHARTTIAATSAAVTWASRWGFVR